MMIISLSTVKLNYPALPSFDLSQSFDPLVHPPSLYTVHYTVSKSRSDLDLVEVDLKLSGNDDSLVDSFD